MKDEEYVYISDVIDKKITARSARNRRTHTGKGGKVRLPSDNLTRKDLLKMNGECKSYHLNEPLTWDEFKKYPDDIKQTYIKLLREKFGVPSNYIAKMLGISDIYLYEIQKKLGLNVGHARGKDTKWDKDGWFAFVNGVKVEPKEETEEPVLEEPIVESEHEVIEENVPVTDDPEIVKRHAIPVSGDMVFRGDVTSILDAIKMILSDSRFEIEIHWKAIPEEG